MTSSPARTFGLKKTSTAFLILAQVAFWLVSKSTWLGGTPPSLGSSSAAATAVTSAAGEFRDAIIGLLYWLTPTSSAHVWLPEDGDVVFEGSARAWNGARRIRNEARQAARRARGNRDSFPRQSIAILR